MGVVQLGCSAASSLATGAAQVQHYPMLPGHVLRQMRHTPVAAPRRFCLFLAILVASRCGSRKRILSEQIVTFAWDALVIGFILQDTL